jgi:bifunctional non-homologous end joining protein LigD
MFTSTIYSKRGNAMKRCQDLAEQVRAELPRREVILNGEIVAIDDDDRINFRDLMRGRGTLAYAAFDVLWVNGRNHRDLPLSKRKQRLEPLLPASVEALSRVPCFEEDKREVFEAACRLDVEGIYSKAESRFLRSKDCLVQSQESKLHATKGRRELFESDRSKRRLTYRREFSQFNRRTQ